MAHVNPMPTPRSGSVPSPFRLAYTLGCHISDSSEAPVATPALAGPPGTLTYIYHFAIDVRWLGTAAGAAAPLLVLAVLPQIPWRGVGRGTRTGLARAAAAAAVTVVLGGGVADFVWQDMAAPAATLLLAGWAGAKSVALGHQARDFATAGWRTVFGIFEAVVVATVLATTVLALALTAVWVLRWVVVAPFARGENTQSSGLAMADYDGFVRMAKARWERPIADWTWADGYVMRPCRFPRCMLLGDD